MQVFSNDICLQQRVCGMLVYLASFWNTAKTTFNDQFQW